MLRQSQSCKSWNKKSCSRKTEICGYCVADYFKVRLKHGRMKAKTISVYVKEIDDYMKNRAKKRTSLWEESEWKKYCTLADFIRLDPWVRDLPEIKEMLIDL